MSVRRRLAALLVSAASSIAPAGIEGDVDSPHPGNTDPAQPRTAGRTETDDAQPARHGPTRDDAIRQLLEPYARSFAPDGRNVRANVMTFTGDRLRRRVNATTAFNMADDPDKDLEVDATAGASGKAVTFRRAAVADLTLLRITDVPPWGLKAAEQARVRPRLKSILSVPIFDPADANGPLLGTLQVDSDLSVEEAGFNRPEAAELAQQFADVVSLLMAGIDVRLGEALDAAAAPLMSHSRVQDATQVEPGMYVANASTSIF